MSDLFTEDSIIMDYGMDYYFVQKLKFKFKKLYGLTEPIHNQMVSKLCNAKFLCSDEKKTTLGCTSFDGLRVSTFSANFHFWLYYSFSCEQNKIS